MNNDNLIYEDESCYGFLGDIIKMFERELSLGVEEPYKELFTKALQEARELKGQDDNCFKIFKAEYNPMGAYVFIRLKEER